MVIQNQKYYIFEGNATLKNLTRFARREYKQVPENSIQPPKGTLGKIFFIASVNLASFSTTLDHLGFDFLPTFMKKLAVILFLFSPIIAALVCIRLTQEPEVKREVEEKKETLRTFSESDKKKKAE